MTHKQRWVLVLTSIASLVVALDVTVVATALSSIRADLGASIEQLEWTVNAYGLSFAVLLLTGAALGDRFGRRRLFVAGLALFSAASAACALAPGVGWLIAARAVQGAGAAAITPVALALLGAAFPPERRGWALGVFGGITGLAVVGGPVIGGAVTQGLAWPWIFWLNVPIGLVAMPLIRRHVAEGHGPLARLDGPGLVLSAGAAMGIVWGLVRGNTAGWGSAELLGALAAGLLLSAAFVAWELRSAAPMLPMRLFRSRAFSAGNAVAALMFGSLFSAVFFMAQFLQTTLGDSPLQAGVHLLPWTGTVFAVTPLAGALVDRIGERPLVAVGLLLQAAGLGSVAVLAHDGTAYAPLIPALLTAGVGISLALPAAQNAVLSGVEPEAIGKASGTFGMARQLGGAFGLAIAVAVFAGAGSYASPSAFGAGFSPALAISAGLSLAGALAGLGLRARVASIPRTSPSSSVSAEIAA